MEAVVHLSNCDGSLNGDTCMFSVTTCDDVFKTFIGFYDNLCNMLKISMMILALIAVALISTTKHYAFAYGPDMSSSSAPSSPSTSTSTTTSPEDVPGYWHSEGGWLHHHPEWTVAEWHHHHEKWMVDSFKRGNPEGMGAWVRYHPGEGIPGYVPSDKTTYSWYKGHGTVTNVHHHGDEPLPHGIIDPYGFTHSWLTGP
jgi:hypothetical protein